MVVGFDRRINYYKIQYATLCIYENPGCLFIATNLDARTHLTDAQEWAGNGAMVGAIKGAPMSCMQVSLWLDHPLVGGFLDACRSPGVGWQPCYGGVHQRPSCVRGFWMSTGFDLDSMAALARKGLPMLYSVLQLAHPGGSFCPKGKHALKLVLGFDLQTQT